MYSVTIVWSAFAFIHLRLVSTLTRSGLPPSSVHRTHTHTHTQVLTLPLVLLNVLLPVATLTLGLLRSHTPPCCLGTLWCDWQTLRIIRKSLLSRKQPLDVFNSTHVWTLGCEGVSGRHLVAAGVFKKASSIVSKQNKDFLCVTLLVLLPKPNSDVRCDEPSFRGNNSLSHILLSSRFVSPPRLRREGGIQ